MTNANQSTRPDQRLELINWISPTVKMPRHMATVEIAVMCDDGIQRKDRGWYDSDARQWFDWSGWPLQYPPLWWADESCEPVSSEALSAFDQLKVAVIAAACGINALDERALLERLEGLCIEGVKIGVAASNQAFGKIHAARAEVPA